MYTDRQLKLVIIDCLSTSSKEHKWNLLGRSHQKGNIERFLSVDFSDSERAQAARCFDYLKREGFIDSPGEDLIDPESWVRVSAKGLRAIETRSLDELDYILSEVDPNLLELRGGVWAAHRSENPDSLRQAAHSARELIRQVLAILAPDSEVRKAEWFPQDQEKVSRRMRVKFIVQTRRVLSKTDVELVEKLMQTIDALYDKLSAEAHRDVRVLRTDLEDLMKMTELSLVRLLRFDV